MLCSPHNPDKVLSGPQTTKGWTTLFYMNHIVLFTLISNMSLFLSPDVSILRYVFFNF